MRMEKNYSIRKTPPYYLLIIHSDVALEIKTAHRHLPVTTWLRQMILNPAHRRVKTDNLLLSTVRVNKRGVPSGEKERNGLPLLFLFYSQYLQSILSHFKFKPHMHQVFYGLCIVFSFVKS